MYHLSLSHLTNWLRGNPIQPIENIPLDGDIEQAGSVYADVVSLLFAVADIAKVAEAAKFVGGIKTLLAKFIPRSLKAGEGVGGIVLEATEGSSTVQIFRDAGDGKPMGLYRQEDFDALQQSIHDEGLSKALCVVTQISRC